MILRLLYDPDGSNYQSRILHVKPFHLHHSDHQSIPVVLSHCLIVLLSTQESLIFTATDLFSDSTCSTPMTIHPVNQTNNQACNAWSSEGNTFAKFNLLDSISLENLGADQEHPLQRLPTHILFSCILAYSILSFHILIVFLYPNLNITQHTTIVLTLPTLPPSPLIFSSLPPIFLCRCWYSGSRSC